MTDDAKQNVSIAVLTEKLNATMARLDKLEKDRDSALRWGIATLGTALVGLGTWVFNLLTSSIKAA